MLHHLALTLSHDENDDSMPKHPAINHTSTISLSSRQAVDVAEPELGLGRKKSSIILPGDLTHDERAVVIRKPTKYAFMRQATSVEHRIRALESLTLITTLLVGEAVQQGLHYEEDLEKWGSWTRMMVYCFLLFSAMMCNLYLSAVSLMVIVACKRVSSWDYNLDSIEDPAEIWSHADHRFVMSFLYGDDEEVWTLDSGDDDGERLLRLPLQYFLIKKYIDGKASMAGAGIVVFPFALIMHIFAFALDYTKEATTTMHLIVFCMVIPFSLATFCSVANLTRVVLH